MGFSSTRNWLNTCTKQSPEQRVQGQGRCWGSRSLFRRGSAHRSPGSGWERQLWAVTPGPRLSLGPGVGGSRAVTGHTGTKEFVSHLGEAQLYQILK